MYEKIYSFWDNSRRYLNTTKYKNIKHLRNLLLSKSKVSSSCLYISKLNRILYQTN